LLRDSAGARPFDERSAASWLGAASNRLSPFRRFAATPIVRRVAALLLTCLLSLLPTLGCTQHARVLCEPLGLASSGRYLDAVGSLDETDVADSDDDRFLYHVQRGHLLHLAGEYEESNAEFDRADAVARELEPWSVSETITDYTFNEAVKAYAGEDYERAYIHYYMALNYLGLGDLDGAIVECRRLDEIFRELDARYEEGTERYQDDGFIRYLSGLLYEARGYAGDAFIDYELAVRAYLGDTGPAAGLSVPHGLLRSYVCTGEKLGREERVSSVLDGPDTLRPYDVGCDPGSRPVSGDTLGASTASSEIVVLIDSGWAPYKHEEALRVPIVRRHVPESYWERGWLELDAVVKIALPEFESVPEPGGGFRVSVENVTDLAAAGRRVEEAELVQDVDALARWSLERRRPALLARSAIRATLKTISVLKAQHEREDARERREKEGKRGSFWTWLADFFVESIMPTAVAETEQADTRGWVLLPGSIWMARVPAEPGEYDVDIQSGSGRLVHVGRLTVREGEKTFLWHRVIETPHPIRCEPS